MIKRMFLDTETTSADRFKCGVWQIGGIIECGRRSEEFLFECDIFDEDEIDEEALKMNNLTIEDLAKKPDPTEVFQEFCELLGKYVDKYDKNDKFYHINFAAVFDCEVIRQWFLKNGDDYYGSWFWHPSIDLMVMAMYDNMGKRQEFKNFKIGTVARHYVISFDEESLHNALYDAKVARAIYYKIADNIAPF
jgi:DNA polymerase-3 subunit epsilon